MIHAHGVQKSKEEGISDATTPIFLPYRGNLYNSLKMVYLEHFRPYYVKSGERAYTALVSV